MDSHGLLFRKESPNSVTLLEEYIPGLRRFALALLRGDRERADDIVQDTLERALSHWHQRRVSDDLRGWIYTILYHRFLSDQRRLRRHARYDASTELLDDEFMRVGGGQEWAIVFRDLLRGFAALPDEQRAVLLLVGVEDFSYADAARLLGVPIGTVMSRLSRGRERLRQYIAGDWANCRSLLVKQSRRPNGMATARELATMGPQAGNRPALPEVYCTGPSDKDFAAKE